jgi:hypothetical protein
MIRARKTGGLHSVTMLFLVSLLIGSAAAAEKGSDKDAQSDEPSLEEKVDVLTEEVSRLREQLNIPETDKELHGAYGLGPAASKVYGVSQGISFGGYGEFYFASPYGDTDVTGKVNTTDFYRFITYIGYKFSDWIVMNAEIEYEHATTSSNYQGNSGSISVEFAYLDFLINRGFNVRGGNLLVPMGFLNLIHEPPTYWGNIRPTIETSIIPTTWREMGLGAHGGAGDFSYSAFVLNGFNGTKFNASGVRGGRQKANRAIWEDIGGVVALDYIRQNGLRIGGSAYWGGADQGLVADTTGATLDIKNRIYEAHVQYRRGGFRTRALVTASRIDNAGQLSWALYPDSATVSQQVPEEQFGWYVEAGYDVAPLLWKQASFTLTPWLRYEDYNLQEKVASVTGLPANPALDGTLVTVGLESKPHPNVVIKLDWVHPTNESDKPTSNEIRLGAGFIY